MRPIRIELEGFSAFRERTVVDFTDVDLFAFVGPTGAGKSSVIDAMIFALYGSVPRLDAKLVHPVITQGKPEARVRLDFEVGGVAHTAVRVVRRGRTGASTKEARLERGGEVLADEVRTMNPAVVELLGLDLDQFTKCVVLPQGAFASLLHETRKHRQDLLVKLLDLGVYGEVASAARQRVAAADHRLAVIEDQVQGLAGATDAAVDAAAARTVQIEGLVTEVIQAEAGLMELADQAGRLRAAEDELRSRRSALSGLVIPDGITQLASQLESSSAAVQAATAAERAATAAVTDAEQARDAAGDAAAVAHQFGILAELDALDAKIELGIATVAAKAAEVEPLRAAADRAAVDHQRATAALDAMRVRHAAVDLARHLRIGDDCPVCGHVVDVLPAAEAGVLGPAEDAVRVAAETHRDADAAATRAKADLDRLEALLAQRRDQRSELAERLEPGIDRAALEARQDAIGAAESAVGAARQAEREARRAVDAARHDHEVARRREQDMRQLLHRQRDPIVALAPPPLTDRVAEDWAALVSWADGCAEQTDSELEAVRSQAERIELERAERSALLLDRAAGIGVAVGDVGRLRDAVVAAAASARLDHERLVADRSRRTALEAERAQVGEGRAVHDAVARRLQPDSFQKWLLGEALRALVAGASERLEELSSGRYGLTLDDDEFAVVDHANADETRMARTLSGGETFLASLALALALAERVSELSAVARSSLDAVFLDEGFGTLDPETLDVVASAIEELGASGRMVGIVSHVPELAERVPVRFEVRRGPKTSTVERVET